MGTHLQSYTRDYTVWAAMKSRCLYPKNIRFHRYGGRGIKVCEQWLNSFEQFIKDMGPSNGMSLDRIDNDGDYEPGNCQWIPFSEQSKKTCRIRYLTHAGETLSMAEWARRLGVSRSTLNMRIDTYGWSIERALSKGGRG